MKSIGIVDVGIGNLGSITGAVEGLGFDVLPVHGPGDVDACDNLILPGVGAFTRGMAAIDAAGLRGALAAYAAAGRPLMGICLGMQILFDDGEEGGGAKGLGLIPGHIRRMREVAGMPLPHVGWNTVDLVRKHPVLDGIKVGVDFYFVHGYCADCADGCVLGKTDYSEAFPAIVAAGSVIGVQFHAEKSQKNGLRLLENFCWWDGSC